MNQSKRAAVEVVKKFFGLPYYATKHLSEINSKKRYDKIFNSSIDVNNNLWESSDKNCSEVCPNNYQLLKGFALREQEDHNILSTSRFDFLNEEEDFATIAPRTFGYCWGFSALNRKFQYLAIFRKELTTNENQLLTHRGKVKFYKKILKKIFRGKLQEIPGYTNLLEFSSDPEIKLLLKKMTVKQWKKDAVTIRGIGMFLKFKQISLTKLQLFIKEVKDKLKTHQTPLIYFNHDELNKYIHVVPVYKVEENEDFTRICFMDNHGEMLEHKECGKHVQISKQGDIYFNDWDDYDYGQTQVHHNIKNIDFVPEERMENINFVKQIKKYCEIKTQCRKN